MTTAITPNDPGVQDFTDHVDVKFRIDDDLFVGVVGIPAMKLLEFGLTFDGLSAQEMKDQPESFTRLFTLILQPESARVFLARMQDPQKPISMTQVMRILPWLMEQYGMRPTEPSLNSSTGSENLGDGTSSTASAQLPVSISAGFPPTGF